MVIDCCGAPGPLTSTTSRPDRNAYPTSVGRLNDMGLGIEEPKHDLGWPSLRPLCRDNTGVQIRLAYTCILETLYLSTNSENARSD